MGPAINLIVVLIGILVWLVGKHIFVNKLKARNNFGNIFYQNLFTLRYQTLIKSLLLPITVSIFYYYLLLLYLDKLPTIYENELRWLPIIVVLLTGIIQPFFEEILYRGIIYGSVLSLIDIKFRTARYYLLLILLSLVLQAWIFGILHNNRFFDVLRFISGLIYGLLYLLNGRNLLPAFIAHSAHNLMIIILFYSFWPY